MQIDTVLIKVASRCNINCSYCYVYHLGDTNWSQIDKLISPKLMQNMANTIGRLAKTQEREFCTILHGGEPLMLGKKGLRSFVELLREQLPDNYPISIQTNGILITNEILDICSKNSVSIAVSLDGPKHVNDISRIDHQGKPTFTKTMEGIKKLEAHENREFLYAGLLAVIDPSSDPIDVYSFFKKINPPSVDFLYKDGNHTRLPKGKSSFHSIEYGTWMVKLLDIYLSDPSPIKIRILDDMLKLLIGGSATKEGMGISDFGILIFDTDGSITKNDTLKSAYDRADQFSGTWKVGDIEITDLLKTEEYRTYHELQKPTSNTCLQCPDLHICGGGMTTHRWKNGSAYNNPTIYCEDQRLLIASMRNKIKDIG